VLPGLQCRKDSFHKSFCFRDYHKVIAFDVREPLDQAICPMNFEVGVRVCAQAKVQAAVVNGVKARLRRHRLSLHLAAVSHDNA
jgi:hypothetical protein